MRKKESSNQEKLVCDRVAELIHHDPLNFEIVQGLNRLSLLAGTAPRTSDTSLSSTGPASESGSRNVGIWIPASDKPETGYIRDPNVDVMEAGMWADCPFISAKSEKKRVVFIGESVARGFFFEPHFSPAWVLESILNTNVKKNESSPAYEVIDLARSDLGLQGLQGLMKDAFQLKPDCMVLFAGNNWIAYDETMRERSKEFAQTIARCGTIIPFKHQITNWIIHQIGMFLNVCKEIIQKQNIPIVFVLPEFNLGDFWSDTREALPYMSQEDSILWRKYLQQSKEALRKKDTDKAEHALINMIQLDGGISSIAPSSLARIYAAQGHLEKAYAYFEAAKDAELWHWLNTPRCYGFIQDLLRKRCHEFGIHLVDLPLEFKKRQPNVLPDRTLFFDYCHLTALGIQVAMSASARKVISCLEKKEVSIDDLLKCAPSPTDEQTARAHLLAANHNASWGQPETIIRHHCKTAWEAHPHVFRKMNSWTRVAGIPLPPMMTSAYQDAWSEEDKIVLYRLGTLGPYLYSHLVDSIESFFPSDPQHPLPPSEHIRASHHNACEHEIDLLTSYSSIRSWAQPEAFSRGDVGFFRTYSLVSQFVFYCNSKTSIHIEITMRIPYNETLYEPVRLSVNDVECFETQLSDRWQTFHFDIQEQLIQEDLNSISITWPVAKQRNHQELKRILALYKEGKNVPFYQPVGDLYNFTASKKIGTMRQDQ